MTRLVTGHGEAAAFAMLATLAAIGEPCDLVRLDLAAFAQWTPQHRALSPDGKPLVLEIDGLRLDHPLLALLYLAEREPQAGLIPADAALAYSVQASIFQLNRQLAESLNILGWLAQTSPADRDAYLDRLRAHPDRPTLAGWSAVWRDAVPPERRADDARAKVLAGANQIAALLGGKDWLVGTHLTVADFAAFALLRHARELTGEDLHASAAMSTWSARVGAEPTVAYAAQKLIDADLERVFCPPVYD